MRHIPISGPWITDKEVEYVADAARNAWYENANIYHDRFEKAFADYIGIKHAIALPSCTSALHLSLLSIGVGPGDEVIVPDITWIATAAPVIYLGATPIFADIDEKSWCLSASSFDECITDRTKAVIPVDLYGGMPDWNEILKIAKRRNIFVIEDAAEALGSKYKDKMAGSLGGIGCFSFHGSKTLTTGEGGMLVTDNKKIHDKVLFLRDHGRKPGDVMFLNEEVAYKYKMSSLQAALGLAQIERVAEIVEQKRRIFSWYLEELLKIDGVTLNYEAEMTTNSYWMVTVILDPEFGMKKEKIFHIMKNDGISCRPFFSPLSSVPAFYNTEEAQKARLRNKISYKISPYGINLPCGMNMTAELVKRVCDHLKKVLTENRCHEL